MRGRGCGEEGDTATGSGDAPGASVAGPEASVKQLDRRYVPCRVMCRGRLVACIPYLWSLSKDRSGTFLPLPSISRTSSSPHPSLLLALINLGSPCLALQVALYPRSPSLSCCAVVLARPGLALPLSLSRALSPPSHSTSNQMWLVRKTTR